MLVRPEGILTIYPIEAYVGTVARAVGETLDVASTVNGGAVRRRLVETFVRKDVEALLAQHGLQYGLVLLVEGAAWLISLLRYRRST